MAAKWTADWVNRLFILKAGVTDIDVEVDLYSDWKEEVQLSDNMKYPTAMRAVGGDPISGTQNLGATFFLINDWKIRPQEADHELTIVGNLFSDPAGEPIVVPTLGDFTVLVTNRVSNLVDSAVARLDLDQLLEGVYIDTNDGIAWDGVSQTVGTPSNPVNNLDDAELIRISKNLDKFIIRNSTISLTQNFTNVVFEGRGTSILNLGGFAIEGCRFKRLFVTGTMVAPTNANNLPLIEESTLGGITNWSGTAANSVLIGNIQIAGVGSSSFYNCVSGLSGPTGAPVIDCSGLGLNIDFRQYTGGLKLEDIVAPSQVSVDLLAGSITLDSTVTGGDIILRGTGDVVDNSTGTANVTDNVIHGDDTSRTRKILANRMETDPGTGIITIYDDDGTVLATAQLFEDAAGTQTYRGQGAERRNKLS